MRLQEITFIIGLMWLEIGTKKNQIGESGGESRKNHSAKPEMSHDDSHHVTVTSILEQDDPDIWKIPKDFLSLRLSKDYVPLFWLFWWNCICFIRNPLQSICRIQQSLKLIVYIAIKGIYITSPPNSGADFNSRIACLFNQNKLKTLNIYRCIEMDSYS